MTDSIIVTDRYRTPIVAEKRDQGGVVLRGPRSWLALSANEFDRLVTFVRNEPTIQRYVMTPQTGPESPQTD